MTRVLVDRSMPPADAASVANALAETSLRGVDTHGIRLFPEYLHEIDQGRAVVTPMIQSSDNGGFAIVDAGNALGIVGGLFAARRAVSLARTHGVSFVGVHHSNHFGAAGIYSRHIADAGMIGIALSNSDALVTPFAGRAAMLGTNPISFAAPSDDGIFCFDMATSQVSYSRVKRFREDGVAIPSGWAVDGEGRDVCGREGAEIAALQPLGGYKGVCLGLMVEVLCALVSGGPFDHDLSHLYSPPYDQPREVSHAFIALDVERIQGFPSRVADLLRAVQNSPASRESDSVAVPGDRARRFETERREHGIPLSETESKCFAELGLELPQ